MLYLFENTTSINLVSHLRMSTLSSYWSLQWFLAPLNPNSLQCSTVFHPTCHLCMLHLPSIDHHVSLTFWIRPKNSYLVWFWVCFGRNLFQSVELVNNQLLEISLSTTKSSKDVRRPSGVNHYLMHVPIFVLHIDDNWAIVMRESFSGISIEKGDFRLLLLFQIYFKPGGYDARC